MFAIDLPPLTPDFVTLDAQDRVVSMNGAQVQGDGFTRAREAFGELLSARDAADFHDALEDAISRVDEWSLPPIQMSHRPYSRADVEVVLGAARARRYMATATLLSARGRALEREPAPKSYAEGLYSSKVHPMVGLALCKIAGSVAAHIAVVVALHDGKALPAHVAEGLTRAVEQGLGAGVFLESLA